MDVRALPLIPFVLLWILKQKSSRGSERIGLNQLNKYMSAFCLILSTTTTVNFYFRPKPPHLHSWLLHVLFPLPLAIAPPVPLLPTPFVCRPTVASTNCWISFSVHNFNFSLAWFFFFFPYWRLNFSRKKIFHAYLFPLRICTAAAIVGSTVAICLSWILVRRVYSRNQ